MRHLSALDALFLHLETPETPMHVGSMILLERPTAWRGSATANIRRHVESRLHLAPLFTQKLRFMPLDLANPVWVDAGDVDLDYHIQSRKLPKPGTRLQLETLTAKLHEGMLERDRPLWQFTVIEGLDDDTIGLYARIHHAALDGQGAIAFAQAVLDVEPRLPPASSGRGAVKSRPRPTGARLLSAAFSNTVDQYSRIVRAVPDAVRMATSAAAAIAMSRKLSSEMGMQAPVEPNLKPKAVVPKGISLGPRTPFNTAISGGRVFASLSLPLEEAKQIARHFDVKLNDVVLALCSGALRRGFAGDKSLLTKSMIGAVPASLRAPGDTTLNNQVTMMLVSLATQIADPVKRLHSIHAASSRAKRMTGGLKSIIPTDLPSLGIPWLMSALSSLYNTSLVSNRIPVLANLTISNVPGPPVPLYLGGARMIADYPVSIVVHGLGLNVTILSYNGSLDFGLVGCKQAVPDIRVWAGYIQAAHQELLDLVAAAAPVAKTAPRAKAAPIAAAKSTAGGKTKVAAKVQAKAKTRTGATIKVGNRNKVTQRKATTRKATAA